MKLIIYGGVAVMVVANTVADGYQPSLEGKYKQATLVMTFPTEEYDEIMRLLNG